MATKKVAAAPLSQTGLSPAVQAMPFNAPNGMPAAIPAKVPPHLQPKPAAKPLDQVKKAVKASPRKETLAAVKATSSKQQTEKTVPYVLLRKATKPGAKATRSIVNFIVVGDTAEASHVRSIRIAVVQGDAFGTNFAATPTSSGVTDIRKARFFTFGRQLTHGKSAKTVSAWDIGNEQAIRALEKLGAISKYDLEFHLAESKRRKAYNDALVEGKAKLVMRTKNLNAFKALAKAIAKDQGVTAVRQAVRAAVPAAL